MQWKGACKVRVLHVSVESYQNDFPQSFSANHPISQLPSHHCDLNFWKGHLNRILVPTTCSFAMDNCYWSNRGHYCEHACRSSVACWSVWPAQCSWPRLWLRSNKSMMVRPWRWKYLLEGHRAESHWLPWGLLSSHSHKYRTISSRWQVDSRRRVWLRAAEKNKTKENR